MKSILILKFKRTGNKDQVEELMKNVSVNLEKLNIAHIVMTDDVEYEVIQVSESGVD